MSMQDKIIAITGGASGIGLATAKLLSSRGATVCIADVDPSALSAAASHFSPLNVPFTTTRVDVSQRAEVESWIDGIVAEHGRLDGAANCAGIIGKHHGTRTIADLDDDEWQRILAVNLTGIMYCLRAELRKVADSGSIVNISSVQGLMGFAGSGAYVASKHGVIGLTRSAAQEVGHRSIRVNAVAPGSIATPLLLNWAHSTKNQPEIQNLPSAIKRLGTAEEVAAVVAFLLGPESAYVSGSVYSVDGGWDR